MDIDIGLIANKLHEYELLYGKPLDKLELTQEEFSNLRKLSKNFEIQYSSQSNNSFLGVPIFLK